MKRSRLSLTLNSRWSCSVGLACVVFEGPASLLVCPLDAVCASDAAAGAWTGGAFRRGGTTNEPSLIVSTSRATGLTRPGTFHMSSIRRRRLMSSLNTFPFSSYTEKEDSLIRLPFGTLLMVLPLLRAWPLRHGKQRPPSLGSQSPRLR